MPALKDCLRNFGKASSRLAFPSAQRTVVIETVGPSTVEGTHQYIAPKTAMSPYGLRAPLALRWSSVSITPYSSFHRTPPPRGGKRRYLVPVARSFTTHFWGAGSSEGRPTSFLLSVASNNARMEVAA